ncbi:MAG: DUF2273 domain-containing protein [Eubacteriales bacterium]|nr:DUF2273 domain-containing protein [Eubacteriales bacterium]
MERQNNESSFKIGTKTCGYLFGGIGAAIALCLILFGFWQTILIALLFAVGYFIGSCNHKVELLKGIINKVAPPKGE